MKKTTNPSIDPVFGALRQFQPIRAHTNDPFRRVPQCTTVQNLLAVLWT